VQLNRKVRSASIWSQSKLASGYSTTPGDAAKNNYPRGPLRAHHQDYHRWSGRCVCAGPLWRLSSSPDLANPHIGQSHWRSQAL